MKTCNGCKIEKSLDCFSKCKTYKDGLQFKCKNCNKEYKENNQEHYTEYNKEWRQNNREHYNKYNNKYHKNRKKTDPAYKIRHNVSKSVWQVLKSQNSKKNGSILKHLPYSIKELKDHLERQFDSNMSWDNHGSYWHIDHIHPQSLLPYTSMTDENFKKCWALENLRPLEAIANIKKSNNI